MRGEGEPEPDDVDVRRLIVEEGARAALPVRAVLRRVRLFDVEEHGSLLVRGPRNSAGVGRYTRNAQGCPAARIAAVATSDTNRRACRGGRETHASACRCPSCRTQAGWF